MRAVLLIVALAIVVVTSTKPLSATSNWSASVSGASALKIWFGMTNDCKNTYAGLTLNTNCNPVTSCTSTNPSLSIANCTASESAFRNLTNTWALQLANDSGTCYFSTTNGTLCTTTAVATFTYSAKASCINDYLLLTGSSYCQILANCGATSPSIVVSGQSGSFYMCGVTPLLNLTASSITFSF